MPKVLVVGAVWDDIVLDMSRLTKFVVVGRSWKIF